MFTRADYNFREITALEIPPVISVIIRAVCGTGFYSRATRHQYTQTKAAAQVDH